MLFQGSSNAVCREGQEICREGQETASAEDAASAQQPQQPQAIVTVSSLSPELVTWLSNCGMLLYASHLEAAGIEDMSVLRSLQSEEDLARVVGINLFGHRRRMWMALWPGMIFVCRSRRSVASARMARTMTAPSPTLDVATVEAIGAWRCEAVVMFTRKVAAGAGTRVLPLLLSWLTEHSIPQHSWFAETTIVGYVVLQLVPNYGPATVAHFVSKLHSQILMVHGIDLGNYTVLEALVHELLA
jgi:hypothetical protein